MTPFTDELREEWKIAYFEMPEAGTNAYWVDGKLIEKFWLSKFHQYTTELRKAIEEKIKIELREKYRHLGGVQCTDIDKGYNKALDEILSLLPPDDTNV